MNDFVSISRYIMLVCATNRDRNKVEGVFPWMSVFDEDTFQAFRNEAFALRDEFSVTPLSEIDHERYRQWLLSWEEKALALMSNNT